MRLVVVSDTHARHARLRLPPGDVLVHCGDFSGRPTREAAEAFLDWMAGFDGARVLVGGNWDRWAFRHEPEMRRLCQDRGVRWLLDEEVEVAGLRFYGAPWTPRFGKGAWQKSPDELPAMWAGLPDGLDVLVTHGPPKGVRDRAVLGQAVGDAALREAVLAKPPRLHVFGHIHEAAGEARVDGCPTRFVNAATRRLLLGVRPPVVLDLSAGR